MKKTDPTESTEESRAIKALQEAAFQKCADVALESKNQGTQSDVALHVMNEEK